MMRFSSSSGSIRLLPGLLSSGTFPVARYADQSLWTLLTDTFIESAIVAFRVPFSFCLTIHSTFTGSSFM